MFVAAAGDGAEEAGGAFFFCEVARGGDKAGKEGGGESGLGCEEGLVVGAKGLGLLGVLLGEDVGCV